MIINIGTAGGKNIKRESIVYCNKFIQRDFDHTPLGFKEGINNSFCENFNINSSICNLILEHKDFKLNLSNIICGTGDNFETLKNCQSCKINELEQSAEDMEAYALALVCKYENLDFIAIKYISDEILLDENKKEQNEQFNNTLQNGLNELSDILNNLLKFIDNL